MAVRIVESLTSEDVSIKKVSIDGMKNTIKYETTINIQYDESKKLSVEAELTNAAQLYGQENEDISINLKSVSADTARFALEIPADLNLRTADIIEMMNVILDECNYVK